MRRLPANPAIPEPGDRRRGGQSAARAQGSVRSPVRTGRGVPPTAATLKAEGDVPVPWLSYRAFRLPCLDPHTSIKPASGRPGPLARNCRFFEESLISSAGLKCRAYFVDALLDAGADDIENLRLRLAVGLGQGPHRTERLFDGLLGHLGRLRRRIAVLRHALQLRSNLAQNRLQHFRLLVRDRLDAIECNFVGLDDRLEVLAAAFHDRPQIDVWQLQLVHHLVEVDNGNLRLVHAWSLSIKLTSEDYIRGRGHVRTPSRARRCLLRPTPSSEHRR